MHLQSAKQKDASLQRERHFEAMLTEVTERKEAEIADLKRIVDVCRKQNQNLQKRLQERDNVIHELSRKCQFLDKIVLHRDSLQQVVDLMEGVDTERGPAAGGDKLMRRSNSLPAKPNPTKNNLTNNNSHGSTGTTFIAIGGSPTGSLTNHVVEVANHMTPQDGDDADDESEGGLGSSASSPPLRNLTQQNLRHDVITRAGALRNSNNSSSVTSSSRSSDAMSTSRSSDLTSTSRSSDVTRGDAAPPTASSRGSRRSDMRHFSISEDDSGNEADDRDSVFRRMRRDRELYL